MQQRHIPLGTLSRYAYCFYERKLYRKTCAHFPSYTLACKYDDQMRSISCPSLQ